MISLKSLIVEYIFIDEVPKTFERRIKEIDEEIAKLKNDKKKVQALLKKFPKMEKMFDDQSWGRGDEAAFIKAARKYEDEMKELGIIDKSEYIQG